MTARKYSRSIAHDFAINIIASMIYTISTQILVYPFISRLVDASEYGIILTIMGVANATGVALGNPLNNTRILLQSKYSTKNRIGDFNVIFIASLIINIAIVFTSSLFLFKDLGINTLLIVIIAVLIMFRSYYTVAYRLVINYKNYLYSNVFGLLGFIIGILFSPWSKSWTLIFLLGELFSCVFIFFTTKHLIFEGISISDLFRGTFTKYSFIFIAALLSTIMSYMDRFLILSQVGSSQVSIYNVASFLGKTGGIILTPIASVLLTYYAKSSKLSHRDFVKRLLIFVSFAVAFYIGILLFGKTVTGFLYPTLIEDSLPYFFMANLASTIFMFGYTIQPTLLRFCDTRWQPIIQGSYILIYLSLGIFALDRYGLLGFCYAVIIANTIQVAFMLSVVFLTLRKTNEIEIA